MGVIKLFAQGNVHDAARALVWDEVRVALEIEAATSGSKLILMQFLLRLMIILLLHIKNNLRLLLFEYFLTLIILHFYFFYEIVEIVFFSTF